MRIGILNNHSKTQQGAYQFSMSVIDALSQDSRHHYIVLNVDSGARLYNSKNLSTFLIPPESSFIDKTKNRMSRYSSLIYKSSPYGGYKNIHDIGLDLLVALPAASLFGIYINVPQVVCIHDMMFRFYPNLPEFPLYEKLRRSFVFRKSVHSAVLCVVESECGKKHVNNFLGLPKDRIKVISYIPPPYIYEYKNMEFQRVNHFLSNYGLPKRYLFYPAQFWKHKNHEKLLIAIHLIKEKNKVEIPIVFIGSKKGNYKNVLSLIKRLNLENQVWVLGYVSEEEVVALYKGATALVFPSLFGPTNLPPIEAIALNIPIICSGIFDMPKQVGEAGVFFNPFDPKDMAQKIYKVWNDEAFRNTIVEKCRIQAMSIMPEIHTKKWINVVNDALDLIHI
jgi:glycosyltransferase involved in cell wall biosynthesis